MSVNIIHHKGVDNKPKPYLTLLMSKLSPETNSSAGIATLVTCLKIDASLNTQEIQIHRDMSLPGKLGNDLLSDLIHRTCCF
jgi:hypothetical protein